MNMKKLGISAIVLLLILVVLLAFWVSGSKKTSEHYTSTKAICNETNYCQDYHILCGSEGMIKATPITGAFIQQGLSWKDPRSEEEKELC